MRMAILLVLILLLPRPLHAGCNLIPVAKNLYPSTLGAVEDPIAAPARTVTLGITPCDASAGFEPVATDNAVELGFEPPGSGSDTIVAIDPTTVTVDDCVLPGGRCGTLRFPLPDTTAELPPHGLAGPARIVVRDAATAVVAQIGTLYQQAFSCDREPETVFQQFTVLPMPNSFADATGGVIDDGLRATVDGGGNLLVPFDYWGGGSNSVLAESPGAPVAIFLEGEGSLGAFGAGDPTTILEAVSAQPTPARFVRSFTLNGRPLPPLLRITAQGTLLGTSDAVESVLRIARAASPGDPPLYDLSDRLFMGRGPIVIDTFTTLRQSPVPLAGLRASGATVAFARDESREGISLNGDMDTSDAVMSIVDAETGGIVNTARAVIETSPLVRNDFGLVERDAAVPAVDVGGDTVAFLESEDGQGVDRNLDGDLSDSFLRVFSRSGEDLTAMHPPIEAAAVSLLNGRPVVVSGRRVFFRGPNPLVEVQVSDVGPVTGLADPVDAVVSPDGAHLYVASNADSSLAIFARDLASGRLTFVAAETLAGKPTAVVLSPDGQNVYVTIDWPASQLAVFARNAMTGAVTLVETHVDDVAGVSGLGLARHVTVSPDGANVYVASPGDDAIAAFTRSPLTGALAFLEVRQQGVGGVLGLTGVRRVEVLPDGTRLFAGPVAFTRNAMTGSLTFCSANDGASGQTFAVSPDGLLVQSGNTSSVGTQLVDPLFCSNTLFMGSADLSYGDGPAVGAEQDVAISPDGSRIYAVGTSLNPGALTTLLSGPSRAPTAPTYVESVFDDLAGVRGLSAPRSIALSPDGRFTYVTAQLDQAVSVFRNDLTLRVFDTASRTLLPDGPLATLAQVAGERAVLLTNEALAGADLDGNGLLTGEVAQLYDASGATPVVTSLGVAANRIAISERVVALMSPHVDGGGRLFAGDPAKGSVTETAFDVLSIAAGGAEVVFVAEEVADAGLTEPYVFFYDPKRKELTGAGALPAALDVESVVNDRLVAFLVGEVTEASAVDRNGDGDLSDVVMHVRDLEAQETINTGHAGIECTLPGACQQFRPFAIDPIRRTVTFLEREADQGDTDLNGDGDALDLVLQVYALRARRSQIVATVVDDADPDQHELLAGKLPPFPERGLQDDLVSHRLRELQVGLDVNDDGMIDDAIAHFVAGDSDGDGLYDDFDNCREAENPDGLDVDADNLGDSACDPDPSACPPAPLPGCATAPTGKASLSITDSAHPAKDALQWKWGKGAATTLADFGNPVSGLSHYSLCVYDTSGSSQPVMRAAAVAQATCGDRACWKATGAKGYAFKDKTGRTTGVRQVKLGTGPAGKAKIAFGAKGAGLAVPPLPAVTPVTVQLIVREGERQACWTATYSTAKKSTPTQLKAVSD